MALQNLHEMIRNLSSYIKSLEVLCESGVRLAKNFERLLSPGPVVLGGGAAAPSTAQAQAQHHLDSDVLTQSVATWELAHKIATADANALISELLPLLQNTVENCMTDPTSFHSTNTYEVFRSCFSAFFQIQWRFCSLYIQCTSSQGGSGPSGHSHSGGGYFSRSPPDTHLARSPTGASFSSGSSGDRRESTESCMSSFSMPRSSISGLSALSSRSTSPSPGGSHHGHFGHSRTRRSSPSVQFTPSQSQPPSPMYLPSGEGSQIYPYLFRRWSAHTHGYSSNPGSVISGQSTSGNISAYSSAGSAGSSGSGSNLFNPIGSRRWSVPAASHAQTGGSAVLEYVIDSSRRSDAAGEGYDYGLLDAINLLSLKPPSPAAICIEESEEFLPEQSTALWPPSETMPGVVLTTCGTESDQFMRMEDIQECGPGPQSLRVPLEGSEPPAAPTVPTQLGPHSFGSGTVSSSHHPLPGEYSLFGPSTSSQQQGQGGPGGHFSSS